MKLALKIASGLLLLTIAFYCARILTVRDFAKQSKPQIVQQLEEAKTALSALRPGAATTPLQTVNDEVLLLRRELERFGLLRAAGFWDRLTDGLKGLPNAFADIAGISGTAVHINDDLLYLRTHGPMLLLNGPGEELLIRLENVSRKLKKLQTYVASVGTHEQLIDATTRKTLIEFEEELTNTREGINALHSLLSQSEPLHLLVLFQNESELRPAGGFLGSYADVTIAHGQIQTFEVRDIYDPDGQLDIRAIPPKPLQRLTRDWEARDANWYFDFGTSARQVISFLNQSKIYSEKGVTFGAAVAINTKVVRDIIEAAGPLTLPAYNITLTPDSFLQELQREVEAGENKKINKPKKILQEATPLLLSALAQQAEEGQAELLQDLRTHFAHKNIMIFAAAPRLQKSLELLGVSGSISPTNYDENILGDYLAVVTANMAGGKSDFVTQQEIDLRGIFLENGSLEQTITITRTHNGENEAEWWYRAPNKTYTQLYLPLGTRLISAAGALPLPKSAGWDYTGYQRDRFLATFEDTRRVFEEFNLERFSLFNKTVFGAWITTPAGETHSFTATYRLPRRFEPSTKQYELIIDRQSGANTSLRVHITAPQGYLWQETNSTELLFETNNPLGVERVVGTLAKQ